MSMRSTVTWNRTNCLSRCSDTSRLNTKQRENQYSKLFVCVHNQYRHIDYAPCAVYFIDYNTVAMIKLHKPWRIIAKIFNKGTLATWKCRIMPWTTCGVPTEGSVCTVFPPRLSFGDVKRLWQIKWRRLLCSLAVICMLVVSAFVSHVCPYSAI